MKIAKLTGIILKLTPAGEFDKLVWLFSKEEGLTRVSAKGVRRPISRRAGALDCLNLVTVELEESGEGGASRRYLREVTLAENFQAAKRDLPRFTALSLMALFLLRLLPLNTATPELWSLTVEAMQSISHSSNIRKSLRIYFLKALKLLGLLEHTLAKTAVREALWKALTELDPQFTLQARRTLGIFESASMTVSS